MVNRLKPLYFHHQTYKPNCSWSCAFSLPSWDSERSCLPPIPTVPMLAHWSPASHLFTSLSPLTSLFLSYIFNLSFSILVLFSSALKHTKSLFQTYWMDWLCYKFWMRMELPAVRAASLASKKKKESAGPSGGCKPISRLLIYWTFCNIFSILSSPFSFWHWSTPLVVKRSGFSGKASGCLTCGVLLLSCYWAVVGW